MNKLKKKKREESLTFAVTSEEKKRIEQAAFAEELTISAYIRDCIKRRREMDGQR